MNEGHCSKDPLHIGVMLSHRTESTDRISSLSPENVSLLGPFDCQPIDDQRRPVNPFAQDFANRLMTGGIDVSIFMTAGGVEELANIASRNVPRQRFVDSLADIVTIAGSPLAGQELQALGVLPTLTVAKDGTWRDVLIAIDQNTPVANFSVAVEVTCEIVSLASGLEARGANVLRLPIFNLQLPDNRQPAVNLFESIDAGEFEAILFPDAASAVDFCFLARHFGRSRMIGHLLDNHLVVAADAQSAEVLTDRGIQVDYQPTIVDGDSTVSLESLVNQLMADSAELRKQKHLIRVNMSGPASSPQDTQAPWYNNPFMQACRGEPTDVTPIWMMRQAGRYMAEYRAVRDKVSFLELCANPQLCSEVMCTAVKRLGVDAAIIFSDLLPILVPMGCDLEFVQGDGPVIHNPVRSAADVDRIKPLESNDELQFVMDTVTQTRSDLPADMPLIGFAGAPFTLASYMIEGGASRSYANTKLLMYSDRGAWDQLMQRLSQSISIYLNGQVAAGAQCLQLFDSWAGCLSFEDYRNFVHPWVKQIIASVPRGVPVINFATGNPALLPLLADTRASVVGIDWRIRLDDAWQTVGYDTAVQGNLDPTVLLANPTEIRKHAKEVLDQAAGRPGHIFNLGHGILPTTPVDNAIALVDIVHELSSR